MRITTKYRFLFAIFALASFLIPPVNAQDRLLDNVESALVKKRADVAKDVTVSFQDGAIVLEGSASSQQAIDDIVLTIGKVDGVKTIINNLRRK